MTKNKGENKVEKFLEELNKLTKKYNIFLAGKDIFLVSPYENETFYYNVDATLKIKIKKENNE